mgnify:CR=1 FL=1
MNIVLDNIIYELQSYGGISVFWHELTKMIMKQYPDQTRFIDNPDALNPYRKSLSIPEDRIIHKNKLVALSRGLPVKVNGHEPFIFHSSYYRYCDNPNAINVTTVHDFTNEFFRQGWKKRLHTWQKRKAIVHSEAIVCVSNSTKNDLLHFFPDIDERKIHVIYNAVSDEYHVLNKNEHVDLPFPSGSFVLFVGNRAAYKNFHLLGKCIKKTPYNLLVIGQELSENEREYLERNVTPDRYKSLGFIPNAELNVLYNHAAALVYPSGYEGFGLPIIEAQLAGCPVIATNISSIPEVIGNRSLLMDTPSEDTLLDKMKLLEDEGLMAKVRKDGLSHAAQFNFANMQEKYISLYCQLLGS